MPDKLISPWDVRMGAEQLGLSMKLIETLQHTMEGYKIFFALESADLRIPGIGPIVYQTFEMSLEGLQEAMQWLVERGYDGRV